ncbi:hypothetical protein LCGC14_3134580, partial [marine sediment metagenome]
LARVLDRWEKEDIIIKYKTSEKSSEIFLTEQGKKLKIILNDIHHMANRAESKINKFEEIEYKKLSNYCRDQKILFLSTPFDFDAVEYLNDLVPIFKISSSDITNLPFIEHIAEKRKPIFLSTGASTIGEIEEAIRVINSKGINEVCIMHCILSYPTDYNDVNLNMITHLKNIFPKYQIGYSDHAKPDPSMLTTTTAYILGAKVIEKHFTLDKTLKGNDHYHAMDLNDLKKLSENIRFLSKIKGTFYKKPLNCEKKSRKYARRSIVVNKEIKKGEIITSEKISFKRPGTGIPPTRITIPVPLIIGETPRAKKVPAKGSLKKGDFNVFVRKKGKDVFLRSF